MLRWKRRFVVALVVTAAAASAAVTDAHGRFFRWWLRPPADPIADVSFAGEAEDGRIRTLVVVNGDVTSRTRTRLDDGTFTATVAAGVLTIDPISLTNTSGTTVTVTLNPATLQRNFFNSTFSAEGTASITDTAGTRDVPVFVFGAISQKNGEYKLRGDVRGLLSVDDLAGTVTYTFFHLELEAEAAVPTVP